MNFDQIMDLSNKADAFSSVMLYILAGIGALLAILLIVWLLFKLSAFIKKKKGDTILKDVPTDEEQLFGD